MNPVPKDQTESDKAIQEFLDNGGKIQHIEPGVTTGIEYKSSFYGKRNKKAEQANETVVDKNKK